jgi:hypothetical protein
MKITEDEAAVIKGMLARGDKQQWITAWFGGWLNSGQISEINTGIKCGERFKHVAPAGRERLPPIGPYISGQSAHRALLALGPVKAAIERAMRELTVISERENGQDG